MVSPLVYAPNHQHIFNVRLDLDIEGINNTVQQSDIVVDPLDEEENPFENAFHVSVKDLKTEKEARANLSLETGRSWKIVNKAKKNFMGQPVGYKFYPGKLYKYIIDHRSLSLIHSLMDPKLRRDYLMDPAE